MGIAPGTLHVRRTDAGRILVEILAIRAGSDPRASREANELVRAGRVQIDGNVCTDAARVLRTGEVVKVLAHALAPASRREDVVLVYVDEQVVVIEKPPGVTTIREPAAAGARKRPGRQETLDQMVSRLLAQHAASRPAHRGGPGRAERVFPVHRLDRDTSGLMVFARTPEARRDLEAQFKARQIDRSYLAVVHGHPPAMTITTHIVRDRGDGLRGSAQVWGKDPADGQRAVTQIEPVEAIGPYALIRCTLETGRTHQIRIHLSEIGHMLCGEKEYIRRPDGSRVHDESRAPRQALHAAWLAFIHPTTGREMRFDSTLPADLGRWLESVSSGSRRRTSS